MRFACAVIGVAALGSWLCAGGPARAQLESREAISLQNQILELRHQIQQGGGMAPPQPAGEGMAPPIGGQGAPASADAAAAGLTPQLLERVSTLEQQVRDMRGQIDQLTNQVQQQNAALSKQLGDISFAQQQAHPESGSPSGPAAAVPTPATRRTPEVALQQGQAALARKEYKSAESAAREVLGGPRGPRQADAQYLLGQSLAGQGQYQQAATAYYDVYSRSPKSSRAPEALLGVAASLLALKDRPDACQALQKLHQEYPRPGARVQSAASSLRARAGCR